MSSVRFGLTIFVEPDRLPLFGAVVEGGLRELKRNGVQVTREQSRWFEEITAALRAHRQFGAQRMPNGRDLPGPTSPTGYGDEFCMMQTMSTPEVAERLKVSPTRVDYLRKAGRLEARKNDRGHWRFPIDTVDEYVRDRSNRHG